MAAMQRLGHRFRAERLLQPRGERRGGRQRVLHDRPVMRLEQEGGRGGAAEAAHRSGGVEIQIVRGLHGRADAGRDLIAHRDRAQQVAAGTALVLGDGQGRGDHRDAGVVHRVAKDVVELDRVGGRAVDPGGQGGKRRGPEPREAGAPMAELAEMRAHQLAGRGDARARIQGREPVQHRALGMVHDVLRQLAARLVLRVVCDFRQDAGHRSSP